MTVFLRGVIGVGLIILTLTDNADANDASFLGEGATVFAFRDHRVRMVSEKIRIRYDTKRSRRRWIADCTFVFQNLSNKTITIQMGFPDSKPFGDARGSWAIKEFTAQVAGKPVKTEHKKVDNKSKSKLKQRVKLAYDAAYTWAVTFKPKEKVTVHNTYRFGGFSSNGPFDGCLYKVPKKFYRDVFWLRAKRPKGGHDYDNCVCSVASYVVTSGRTWAGTIGKADIAIEIPPHIWPNMAVPIPPSTELTPKWVRWQFKNWRPTRELSVIWVRPLLSGMPPIFQTVAQAKAWRRFARKHGATSDLVAAMKAGQLAGYGVAKATPSFYTSRDMYEPVKKPRKLGKTERRILKVLSK